MDHYADVGSMVIFHQIKLFGMLSNELTAIYILVDVVDNVVLMNKDHSNALCCPVKRKTSYFPYSHTNSLHSTDRKHNKYQHSKNKNYQKKKKTQALSCMYRLSYPGTISRPYMNMHNCLNSNFANMLKQTYPTTVFINCL